MNLQALLGEIEKTFAFYEAGDREERKIDALYLSGGLSKLDNLPAIFEEKTQIKTEILNPFRRIEYNDKKFDSIYFEDLASLFGVASGLATWSGGQG